MTPQSARLTETELREYMADMKARKEYERRKARQRRKFKRMKPTLDANAITVHLNDEAPVIGSGIRRVAVESLGPVWVKLRSPATGKGTKVPRSTWDEIVAANAKRESR
jgi:hypothetical protein